MVNTDISMGCQRHLCSEVYKHMSLQCLSWFEGDFKFRDFNGPFCHSSFEIWHVKNLFKGLVGPDDDDVHHEVMS